MKISIIISYYKRLEYLTLILKALNRQSVAGFEVIVSEDDYNQETSLFLSEYKDHYNFPIIHVNQKKDDGFRKNEMLNKAIKEANGKTLVFIDGDCIPHKHFVKAYQKNSSKGYMIKGRRVMLDRTLTNKILKEKSINKLNLISILKSASKKKKEAFYTAPFSLTASIKDKYLLGCNWGIYKEHLLQINGFDEDYIRASVGEDTDIEWRLKVIGIKSKSIKNKAIVYHLHHEKNYKTEDVLFNREILADKLKKNAFICKNGINKLDD